MIQIIKYMLKGEIEISTIVKIILVGIGLVLLLFIIRTIFVEDISRGFDSFFNLF